MTELENIADGVWGVRSRLRSGLGVVFPLRATVIRLRDGGLWTHSPVRFSDAEAAAIDALGPVRHVVAPNAFHHLFAGDALRRWPGATLSKSPALVKKRPDLAPAHVLGDGTPPWPISEIEAVPLGGAPMVRESAFIHVDSGTLLLTDAAFNIRVPETAWSSVWFSLTGANGRFVMSRIYRMVVKDRAAAAESARAVLEREIRRVVPCHGEVVTEDAREALLAAWAWLLQGRGI